MNKPAWTSALVAIPLAVGVSAPGCDWDFVMDLVGLDVRDRGQQGCEVSSAEHLAQPVALGSQLDLEVLRAGTPSTLVEASVAPLTPGADPAFTMDDLDLSAGHISLRAQSEGLARLRVGDDRDDTTAVDLRVAPVASWEIEADALTWVNLAVDLTEPHPDARAAHTAAGWALLPAARIQLDARMTSASGEAMIGHGLAQWTATPDIVDFASAVDHTDDVHVQHRGEAGDVVVSVADGQAAFDLVLHPADVSLVLSAYWPRDGLEADEITVAHGETVTLVAVLRDDAGRLVLGDLDQPFGVVEVGEGLSVVGPPWQEDADEDWTDLLKEHRVAYVHGDVPGEALVVFTVAGHMTTVTVTVTPTDDSGLPGR